jgi:NEDD4-binding protein 2
MNTSRSRALNYGYKGVILSSDEYFIDPQSNQYRFDQNYLDEAHQFTHRRGKFHLYACRAFTTMNLPIAASDAFKRLITPIIIDNTNVQAWEMKPYIAMVSQCIFSSCKFLTCLIV